MGLSFDGRVRARAVKRERVAPRTLDDGRGTRELVASTALCGCRIDRALGGRVELVEASRANRRFPLRVTESLGVCLKVGPAHRVMADGCEVVYPEDAICVRPPGCVWSADATGPNDSGGDITRTIPAINMPEILEYKD